MAGIGPLPSSIVAGAIQRMAESLAQTLTQSLVQTLPGIQEALQQQALFSTQQHLQALEGAMRALEKKIEEANRANIAQHQELEGRVCQLEVCVKAAMGKLDIALMRLEERLPTAPSDSPPVTSSSSSFSSSNHVGDDLPSTIDLTIVTSCSAAVTPSLSVSSNSTLRPSENPPSAATATTPREQGVDTATEEALFKAIESGQVDEVRRLLHDGVYVNFKNKGLGTPLHAACLYNHTDVISLLLEKGANVNATSCFGETPLHNAAASDSTGQCASLLLSAGAGVNKRDKRGKTPLHWAAEHARVLVIETLVIAGANVNMKTHSGNTPLHFAASSRYGIDDTHKEAAAHALIRAGAQKNIKNRKGQLPLHMVSFGESRYPSVRIDKRSRQSLLHTLSF